MKLVNQQVIKNTNMKRLYTSIYSSPGISRAHLAKQTKLSKTTVSTLVDELIEREFIVDSGIGESDSIGRKPNCLQVRMNSYYIVVMNWHENTVEAYLVDIAALPSFTKDESFPKMKITLHAPAPVSGNPFWNTVLLIVSLASV